MVFKPTKYRPRRFIKSMRRRKPTNLKSLTMKSGYSSLKALQSRPYLFKRYGIRTTLTSNNSSTLSKNSGGDAGFTLGTGFLDAITDTKGYAFSHLFQLSQMPNYSEFTALFDKYKICKVVWTIMFHCNTAPMNGNSILPLLHVCSDDDDANVPGGLAEIQQRSNVKRRVLGTTTIFKYVVRPKLASAIYNTATSTGYAIKSGYVNTDYPNAEHYGIKGIINNLWLTTNNNVAITIEPVYYLAMKEVK